MGEERDEGSAGASADAPGELTPGDVVDGRYVIQRLMARGGMGLVYECTHQRLGKRLALKVIRPDVGQTSQTIRRFLVEAQAASAIGNEHIVDVSDFGELPGGASFFVMEYLEGIALSELIEENEHFMPVDRLIAIGRQVADGLDAAHAAGIVHRDLKPENLFLTQRKGKDFVKILDFGVARTRTSDEEKLTLDGTILGTPHYMAPEQAQGSAVDARADIYSLGVILYELASGQLPFDGEHYMAVLTQHLLKPPPAFHELDPPAPVEPRLAEVIFRCLEKSPKNRYASMQELRRALGNVRSDYHSLSTAPRRAPALAEDSHGIMIQGAARPAPLALQDASSEALALAGDAESSPAVPLGANPGSAPSGWPARSLALMGGVAVSLVGIAVWLAVSVGPSDGSAEAEAWSSDSTQRPSGGILPALDTSAERGPPPSSTPTVRVVDGAAQVSSAQHASLVNAPAKNEDVPTAKPAKAPASASEAPSKAHTKKPRKASRKATAVPSKSAPATPQASPVEATATAAAKAKARPSKLAPPKPASTNPSDDGLLRPW